MHINYGKWGFNMIKNIIFDLRNVIINYNQEKIIKYFTQNKDEHDYIIIYELL